jgi:hypothetical protein
MRTALGPADPPILGIVPGALRRDLDRSVAVPTAEPSPQRRHQRALGQHECHQVVGCEVEAAPRSGLLHGVARMDQRRAAARWPPRIPARRAGIGR